MIAYLAAPYDTPTSVLETLWEELSDLDCGIAYHWWRDREEVASDKSLWKSVFESEIAWAKMSDVFLFLYDSEKVQRGSYRELGAFLAGEGHTHRDVLVIEMAGPAEGFEFHGFRKTTWAERHAALATFL